MSFASQSGPISRLAASQHGLIAVWQLRGLGLGEGQIRSWRRAQRFLSYRRGVLRLPGVPESPERGLMAACLAAGPGAVASHWAAGALLQLRGCGAGTLEVTVHHQRQVRLDDVRVHRVTRPLPSEDRARHHGVPTTTAARTIVDLASTEASGWLLERMLDDAVVRGLTTPTDLAASMERAGTRRSGASALRGIITARKAEVGRRFDSHLELRVLRALNAARVATPTLHHLVDTPGGIYEIDIAWPTRMAGLDVHGFVPHGTRSALDHDARRGLWLLRAGWRIGVVTSAMTSDEIMAAADAVLSPPS